MARIKFEVQYTTLEGDYGDVDGIEVICSKCGHSVEVYGDGPNSIKRGAAMLNSECPEGENNYYEEI